jgi:hypothetical protein
MPFGLLFSRSNPIALLLAPGPSEPGIGAVALCYRVILTADDCIRRKATRFIDSGIGLFGLIRPLEFDY